MRRPPPECGEPSRSGGSTPTRGSSRSGHPAEVAAIAHSIQPATPAGPIQRGSALLCGWRSCTSPVLARRLTRRLVLDVSPLLRLPPPGSLAPAASPTSRGHPTPPWHGHPTSSSTTVTPAGRERQGHSSFAPRTRWDRSLVRRPSPPEQLGVLDLRVRGVGELAELTGDQERHLLADVHRVVADPLDLPRHEVHPDPPLEHALVVRHRKHLPQHAAVQPVDRIVHLREAAREFEIATRERVHGRPTIRSASAPISSRCCSTVRLD